MPWHFVPRGTPDRYGKGDQQRLRIGALIDRARIDLPVPQRREGALLDQFLGLEIAAERIKMIAMRKVLSNTRRLQYPRYLRSVQGVDDPANVWVLSRQLHKGA